MLWIGKSILLVAEDPYDYQEVLTTFEENSVQTITSLSVQETNEILEQQRPDLILLEATLPDSLDICRRNAIEAAVPLVLLAPEADRDVIMPCLEVGTEEFVIYPFDADEVLLRSWLVIKRAEERAASEALAPYNDGYLSIDLGDRRVVVEEQPVKLTPTEFRLLSFLYRRIDFICTFEQLMYGVWGEEFRNSAEKIHVYIWHLRQKLEPDPKKPIYLVSEHSIGYRFQSQPA